MGIDNGLLFVLVALPILGAVFWKIIDAGHKDEERTDALLRDLLKLPVREEEDVE